MSNRKFDIDMRAILDKMKSDLRDAAAERSRLCPGSRIPDYVLATLPARARGEMAASPLHEADRFAADLDRPLRLFLENGLEIRIVPAAVLDIRAIYHAPGWTVGLRPSRRAALGIRRAPFEATEETVSCLMRGWSDITDPELSTHARLAVHALRQRSSGRDPRDLSDALHVDVCYLERLQIDAPEATIRFSRPEGTGLAWDIRARGRHRGDPPTGPRAPQGTMHINRYLRHAAAWIDACHAALPRHRRIALEVRGALDRARLSL